MRSLRFAFPGLLALLAVLLAGCGVDTPHSPRVVVPQPTGSAYFATYVSLGNSLTAGYMDGGLMINGQLGSYPSLIARQLGKVVAPSAAATFSQPYINRPGVGTTSTGNPAVTAGVLHWVADAESPFGGGIALLGTTATASVPALALMSALPLPYNNLGVPGATTHDVLQALTHVNSQAPGNAYFDLILRNPTFGNVTMLGQAISRAPTLVTVWIGNNDVLGGALSGNPALGVNVTPPSYFGPMYAAILDGIAAGVQARAGYTPLIVAANVPSNADNPYFVPKAQFDFVVQLATPTQESDVAYVLFPALGYLQGGGSLPLPGSLTLTQAEVATLNSAVIGINARIDALCAARNVPVVNTYALLNELNTTGLDGLVGGNYLFLSSANRAKAAFSLDGIHPNNRGQGLVANAFIDAINGAAGTEIAHVDIAALAWDPTYGAGGTSAGTEAPRGALMSSEIGRAHV
jgi:hypothetical protein